MSMANPWIRKAEGGPLDDVDWSQMNRPFGGISPVDVPMSTRIGDEAQEGLVKAGMNPFAAEHLRQGFGGILDMTPLPAAIDTVDAQARGNKWDVLKGMTRMIPGVRQAAGRALAPMLEQDLSKFAPKPMGDLRAMLGRKAPVAEIKEHPDIIAAQERNNSAPQTHMRPDYGTPEFQANRQFDIGGEKVVGYHQAIPKLEETAKAYSTEGPVGQDRIATIVLGPPASGKSRLSEQLAAKQRAAIVDPDDVKKTLPEYNGGATATAVHEESAEISSHVLGNLMRTGHNIVVPRVGANLNAVKGYIDRLHANDYKVGVVNMTVAPDEAYRRMVGRYLKTGRIIGSDYFEGVGTKPRANFYSVKDQPNVHEALDVEGNGPPGTAYAHVGEETSLAKALGVGRPGGGNRPALVRGDGSAPRREEEVLKAAGGGVQGADNPYAQFDPKPAAEANPYAQFDPKPGAGGMEWGDVAGQAIANAPQSALNFAKDTVQPILHPIDTLEGIGNLALGSMQKAGLYGGDSYKQYPEALGKFFVDRYGSIENAKKTLATDPVGALSDASVLLTGGGSAAERLPGMLGKAGEIMSDAGRMTDPLLAPITAAKLGTKGVGHLMTHTGAAPLDTAYKTGVEGGEAGETFRSHMRGEAPMEEPVEIARQGLEQFRRQRGQEYRANMNEMRMSDTQFAPEDRILDFGKVDTAVDKAMNVQTFKGKVLDPGADAVRSDMIKAIDDWRKEPKATFHTVEGIDALKRKLGNMMMDTPPNTSARKASGDIYNAVRKTITDYYPEYAKTMKSYEQASGLIKDIESSLSLGKRANVDTSLRKLQAIMRNNVNTNFGRRMQLGQLLEENGAKHLMAALAGQSLNTWVPRGLGKLAAEGAALGVAGKLMSPWALATAPLMSPRLMGEAGHIAGRTVGRGLEKSDRALGRVGLSNRAVGQIAYRIGRTAREVEPTVPALQAANRAGANPFQNPDLSERLNVYPTMMRQ